MNSNEEVIEPQKRIAYWDNLKGLLIFLVVIGHFLYELRDSNIVISNIAKFIYLFHMPAFAFVTGFWTKDKVNVSRIKKYLFFYFVGNTFMMWYAYIAYGTAINLLVPYYSFWYLIALIVWKTCGKLCENIKGILLISIAVGLLVGLFPEVTNVLALQRMICFFPFFILGMHFNKRGIFDLIKDRRAFLLLLAIFFILGVAIISVTILPEISFDGLMMSPYTNHYEMIYRGAIYVAAFFMIFVLLAITTNKHSFFIEKIGRNSLYIYIFHRIFTLIIPKYWTYTSNTFLTIGVFLGISILLCAIWGSEIVRKITDKCYDGFLLACSKENIGKYLIVIALIITLLCPLFQAISKKEDSGSENKIYSILSNEEQSRIDNAFSILFTGDLILLKEQVERGYDSESGRYSFDDVFEYNEKYISQADLSIGVFEGPMAGESAGYSNSDFDDGIDLYLNYPDEFGQSVQKAGYDLVTVANNHVFDRGIDGAIETVNKLEQMGIAYSGFYRNDTERKNAQIYEKDNIKFGVLSYTYGANWWTEKEMYEQQYVPIIVDEKSEYFDQVKADVIEDFEKLKNEDIDVIIVLPHYGTQFTHTTDAFQETWNKIFLNAGANIILGDHSHSVQPVEIVKNCDNKDAFIVNSPGNFANSYREYDGDATAMVEIYLDKENGNFIASSIIPMYVQAIQNSNYRAIPINDIVENKISFDMSTYEFDRVKEVFGIITESMIGEKLDINASEEKLYYTLDGYKRGKTEGITINSESKISKLIEEASTICFIGDSITEGTMNGGYGWYEPLMSSYTDKEIINISAGGATTKTILEKVNNNSKAKICDLYVIAIGTNDIRYRSADICAMDENEYVENIKKIIEATSYDTHMADYVLIAPWGSTENDAYSMLNPEEKQDYMERYSKKLEEFCNQNEQSSGRQNSGEQNFNEQNIDGQNFDGQNTYLYINPNKIIFDTLSKEPHSKYMVDFIHPNSKEGIELYSRAVQS